MGNLNRQRNIHRLRPADSLELVDLKLTNHAFAFAFTIGRPHKPDADLNRERNIHHLRLADSLELVAYSSRIMPSLSLLRLAGPISPMEDLNEGMQH
jgi:hypothetical protein